jgi:menaquinone-9 beta-reductase
MSEKIFDLVIVGGGPAGATAALYAQRAGLTTCLVDKATFPRDKICGDALLEKIARLPGAPIHEVVFGSPNHVQASIDLGTYDHRDLLTGKEMPMEGYVIRREVLDDFMFGEARNAVDVCVEGFVVRDVILEGSQVVGIEGCANGESRKIHGRVVLGCDGFNSVVARKVGLYKHDSRHSVVALRCYYENVGDLTDQIELHFVEEVLPGYFWIFPLDKGQANVGIGMRHDMLKKKKIDLKVALQKVIQRPPFVDRFAQARPLEEPVGWNLPVGSTRRRSYTDGCLLLGDAAGLIDPFTGEGIGNALYSARFAVDTVTQAIGANDFSAPFLQRYEAGLWDTIGDELATSSHMQRLGRWKPLLNFTVNKAARNDKVRDLICGMMANAVPKKQLTNPLFYLKLLLS